MKILFVTNIPSPYRNKLFNEMGKILPADGIEFEVWYMAEREPNRHWKIPKEDFQYSFKIFRGWMWSLGRYFLHFNLGLIRSVYAGKFDFLIVGGAYSSPTHMMLSLLPIRKSKKILWSEGNIYSMQIRNALIFSIKKYLISRYGNFIVPGKRSEDLIKTFVPSAGPEKFLRLPNLVDEDVYNKLVKRKRVQSDGKNSTCKKYNIDPQSFIFFAASRPDHMKGLDILLKSLAGISGVCLVIAGDGPLKDSLTDLAKSLDVNARFIGDQQQSEIVDLYAAADVFVIPSTWDSNPLAVIEAIAAGLPVIASPYIGNFEDVLIPGKNGWVFDPYMAIDELNLILKLASSVSRDELRHMGACSEEIYFENFSSGEAVTRFAGQLKKLA